MKIKLTFTTLFKASALALILSLSSLASAQRVVGYMPYWAGSSSAIQYDKLTHINYSFALPNADGSLKPLSNPGKLQDIVNRAHAVGTKVFIAVGGWSDQGQLLDSRFETLAANPTSRNRLISQIMALVNQYNLDGVDMDWEYPDPGSSASNFEALMRGLADQLHPQGKELSAAVVAHGSTGGGVNSNVLGLIDFLNIMAYDANNANHSPMSYAQQSLAYWVGTRGLPKSKAVLGVPFYARPSWQGFNVLLANGANPNADVFNGNYYNGIPTIKAKAQLVKDNSYGGIMIWELSQDATGQNSLLSAIHSVLGGGTNPNIAPSVSLTSPANGSTFNAGSTVTISANASDSDGSVTKVEFYRNGQKLGEDASAPYSFSWTNATAGNYSITAKATDNNNASTTSAAVSITINNVANQAPTVSLTSPANGTSVAAGSSVTISANASDADGSVSSVTFYVNGAQVGQDASAPYSTTWTAASAGNYSVTAVARDNANATTTSAARSITVTSGGGGGSCNTPAWSSSQVYTGGDLASHNGNEYRAGWYTQGEEPGTTGQWGVWRVVGTCDGDGNGTPNQAPTVSLNSPANGSTVQQGSAVNINASAQDSDGSIAKVEFFVNGAKIGQDVSAPYSFSWNGAGVGSHSITVKATDNEGATKTSGAVNITVEAVNNDDDNGNCSAAAWSSSTVYTKPNKVSYNGTIYEAHWWTQGDIPGTTGQWGVWRVVGTCQSSAPAAAPQSEVTGVYPNPFFSTLNIDLVLSEEGVVTVQLYDSYGYVAYSSEEYLGAGQQHISIAGNNLPAGFYSYKVSTSQNVLTGRVQHQN